MIEGTAFVPSRVMGEDRLLDFSNMGCRLQEVDRVIWLAVDQHLVVQMRTRRPAGAPEEPDLLPKGDHLALADQDAVEMRIARVDVVAVIDLDHEAIAGIASGEDDA